MQRTYIVQEKTLSTHTNIATMKQVAELAGVSISTVSRALTSGGSVSSGKKERVSAAIKALKYHPNRFARSMITGKSSLIGLVVDNYQNPVFNVVFELFTARLQQAHYHPLLINLSNKDSSQHVLDIIAGYKVDGIIVASSTLENHIIQQIAATKIPMVQAFGRRTTKAFTHPCSYADNYSAGKLIAEIALAITNTDIAFLAGPKHSSSTKDRLDGFSTLYPIDKLIHIDYAQSYSYKSGFMMTEKMLGNNILPTVICCGDDSIAIGTIDALRKNTIQVPQQVKVVGFNDIAISRLYSYQLTTITLPVKPIIESAIENICKLIQQPLIHIEDNIAECKAVHRKTTAQ